MFKLQKYHFRVVFKYKIRIKKIIQPKSRKHNLQLKQFDGTVIKAMGTFERTFEAKKRFKIIPITIVPCNKDHGLLGIDVLKVDATKLIISIKATKKNNILSLKGYRLSIRLKENHRPSYSISKKFSIHILPMVVANFLKK